MIDTEDDGIKHGTRQGYRTCGKRPQGRCEICKTYRETIKKKSIERKVKEILETGIDTIKHGTDYGYQICRNMPQGPCERCLDSNATQSKTKRERAAKAEANIKHGTSSGYKQCRKRPKGACSRCKNYNNRTAKKRREKLKRELKAHPENFKHGRLYTYHLGCRCPECKSIGNEKGREYHANRAAKPIPEDAHGTLRGYKYYKCRDECCVEANKFYNILRKAQRQETEAQAISQESQGL